ncbi:MAG TPA: outer membrane lipoprotein-sorting protein [Myxococcota bacterium]|nr:outer membrane lipoprotein-sorting protein [Myxococcota bacterium]
MTGRRSPRIAGVIAAALALAGPARAEGDLDPHALLARAFANLYADDYIQTMELAAQSPGMRPVVRTLQILRKQSITPGKALVRFLEPPDVRRTSVLILENATTNDDLWVYLPALRMTRRISSSQRADSFFGTDLSYEDVEPKHADDYDVVPGGAAEDAAGCVVLDIRARPPFESTYERMLSCVEPERALIRWTDFYRKGERVKQLRMDPKSVKPIGERFIPFLITMETLRTRSRTEVRTQSYELVKKLDEKLFNTWNLEAGDAEKDRNRVGVSQGSN